MNYYQQMKRIIVLFFSIIFLLNCSSPKNAKSARIGIRTLPNYFANNTVSLQDEYNFKVINSNTDFDKTFGIPKTAENNHLKPDFSSQIVVAVIMKPTNKKTNLRFDKAEIVDSDLNVYYLVHETGNQLNYSTSPTAVATVPKSQSVKKVNFITRDKIAGSESVK